MKKTKPKKNNPQITQITQIKKYKYKIIIKKYALLCG